MDVVKGANEVTRFICVMAICCVNCRTAFFGLVFIHVEGRYPTTPLVEYLHNFSDKLEYHALYTT